MMTTDRLIQEEEYRTEIARMAKRDARELIARRVCHGMYGGDNPAPTERPMPTIIAQFGEWAVTPEGVQCLVYPYEIQWDSLTDPLTPDEFWVRNLASKAWVNLHDAMNAIRHGRQIHRYLHNVGTNNNLE
jgi:hypothetical protein